MDLSNLILFIRLRGCCKFPLKIFPPHVKTLLPYVEYVLQYLTILGDIYPDYPNSFKVFS